MIELVFVHGWGFDAAFWDALAPMLAQFPQRRFERGYFGAAQKGLETESHAVLIGHSLGFMSGMHARQGWSAWIAINGFARFVRTPEQPGCVSPNVLEDMQKRLARDPAKTLEGFYRLIEYTPPAPPDKLDTARLGEGLDELRAGDLSKILPTLKSPGLVLAARNDILVPQSASGALVQTARNAEIKRHETGGHLLPRTEPAWCARMIGDFLGAARRAA